MFIVCSVSPARWYKVAASAGVQDADTMLRKCQKYYVVQRAEVSVG